MIRVALIGNPNVGKSTLFNELTGLHQHTGNWTGKTVSSMVGYKDYKGEKFEFYDLPGTYSLIAHSEEEKITSDFILSKNYDVALVVCDSMCLERNLNLVLQTLEVTNRVVVCINLIDEAQKNNININFDILSKNLDVPVVGISARQKKGINKLLDKLNNVKPSSFEIKYDDKIEDCLKILNNHTKSKFESIKLIYENTNNNLTFEIDQIYKYLYENNLDFNDEIMSTILKKCGQLKNETIEKKQSNKKFDLDKIITNKITGIPIMIIMLMFLFWISIVGANYPSNFLLNVFNSLGDFLREFFIEINVPWIIYSPILDGVYKVLTWVVAVMLPPMSIFFPLFTLLEDFGILPRIAFNLDGYFEKNETCGKQALTMCMGIGCNAVGVTGARIIDSERERLIAILTNSFIPCNGRFPILITIFTIFFSITNSTFLNTTINVLLLTFVILFSVFMTFIVSKILSKTILKGDGAFFILELPPYRKPQIFKVLVRSLIDRTLKILLRSMAVAAPAGLAIWLLMNINISGISIFGYIANFLNPFGVLIGLDGVILLAFLLGFPANEIVLPIIMMGYMSSNVLVDVNDLNVIYNLLLSNGWTLITAICMIIFVVFHYPCSTTMITIYKETKSLRWTLLAFLIPILIGIILCFCINFMGNIFI